MYRGLVLSRGFEQLLGALGEPLDICGEHFNYMKLFKRNMGTVDHAVKMPCIDMSNVQCVDGGMILNALNKFE